MEHPNKTEEKVKPYKKISKKISGWYLLIGLVWLTVSDKVINHYINNESTYQLINTAKGYVFIFLSAVFIYWLVSGSLKNTQDVVDQLHNEHEKLVITNYELATKEAELQRSYEEAENTKKLLEESQERFQLALEGSRDAIWDWNINTNEVYFGPRWEKMLGSNLKPDDTMEALIEQIHPGDREKNKKAINAYLEGKTETYKNTFRLKNSQNEYIWISQRGKAIWSQDGTPVRMIGSITDITQEKELENKIYELAYMDDLTLLPNKHDFKMKLESMIVSQKYEKFAVLYLA